MTHNVLHYSQFSRTLQDQPARNVAVSSETSGRKFIVIFLDISGNLLITYVNQLF